MKHLAKDDSLCIGCHQCEEACAQAFFKTTDRKYACIRIEDTPDAGIPHVCNQCGKCAEVCNTCVITQGKNGVYRINKKECAGCLMCVGFCPEQCMVQSDELTEPSKCSACGICVKICPTGALYMVEE